MRNRAATLLVLVAIACIWASCAREPEEGVLAEVDGTAITEDQLDERMAGMPAYMRQQFETPEGKRRLLDDLVEEELYYKDAVATGLDKRADLKAEMGRIERNLLIRHYFSKVIEVRSAVADSEVVDYYNEHPQDFLAGKGDSVRPFTEVREDIVSRLTYLRRRQVHDELRVELKAKYGVEVAPDSVVMAAEVGPEEELAVVAGTAIRRADLDDRMEVMPAYMREQFQSPQGKKRLLEGVVDEEIFLREAKATGLDKQEDYKQEVERVRRSILVKNYIDRVIQERSEPTEEEVALYYEEHKSDFGFNEYAKARHILVSNDDDARRIRQQLDDGADFAELAREHSLDMMSRDEGGLIAQVILPQRPVQGLGEVPEFSRACFNMKQGDISVPIKTAKGYHIIKIEERGSNYVLPFEEAREDVVQRVRMDKRGEVQGNLLAELKTKYSVVYVTDVGKRSPEDLFQLASESGNPREKIRYYEQFLEEYPDNERAYEAKFMIGFTYAEDLRNYPEAQRIFEEFLVEYPGSDLGDDARWMLENMTSGEHPEFETEGS